MAASTNEVPLRRRRLQKCCCGSEFQTGSREMLRAQTEGCVSGGCWQGDLLLQCFPEYVVGGHPGRLWQPWQQKTLEVTEETSAAGQVL